MLLVLFTGTRRDTSMALVQRKLEALKEGLTAGFHVIVGDCPTGVDAYVRIWCAANRVPVTVYKADWTRYGKAAGPMRNRAMVNQKPHLVLAFPMGESRGTRGTIAMAQQAKLNVVVTEL